MLFNKGVAGIISSNVPVTIPQDQSYGEKEKRIDQMNTMASTFLHEMAHQVKDTSENDTSSTRRSKADQVLSQLTTFPPFVTMAQKPVLH